LEGIKKGNPPSMYKIEEGKISQLDIQGTEITRELAQPYVLTKNKNLDVEDKRWKLVELHGKLLNRSAETHYIIFHSKGEE
jgi:copper homeostasis protein (lipoprotein)